MTPSNHFCQATSVIFLNIYQLTADLGIDQCTDPDGVGVGPDPNP